MMRLNFLIYMMIIFVSVFGIKLTEGKETHLQSKVVRVEKQELSKELLEIVNSKDMRRQSIRRIQELLFQLGYDPGPIDGLMGKKTRTALTRWEKEKNQVVSSKRPETRIKTKKNANIYKPKSFGIEMSGSKTTQYRERGESFSLHYKSMRLLPSDDLSQSWVESIGQTVEPADSGWILYSSGPIVSVSTKNIAVKVNRVTKVFDLNAKTTMCDGPHRIPRHALQKGEMVTVSTRPDSAVKALKIRKGPILVKGAWESSDRDGARIPVSDKLINVCQLKW